MRAPRCYQHIRERRFPSGCAICRRIRTERTIARKIVITLLERGWELWVDYGEVEEPTFTKSYREIAHRLMACDEETICARRGDETGWVSLLYGNSGWDVICDLTMNLDDELREVSAYAERLSEKGAA